MKCCLNAALCAMSLMAALPARAETLTMMIVFIDGYTGDPVFDSTRMSG